MRLVLLGPPGRARAPRPGQVVRAARHPGHLDRRHLPGQRLAGHPARASRRSATWTPASTSPTGHQRDGARPARRSPTAEPGFLLDGYPRTLDAGRRARRRCWPTAAARSTRVVELTVDTDEVVAAAAAARPQSRAAADDTEDVIRRRLEVYAEQTAPLAERLRATAGCCVAGRRHRRGRRGHGADPRPPSASPTAEPRRCSARRDRIEIKTPEQIAAHARGRAGRRPAPWTLVRQRRGPRGHHRASSTRSPRRTSATTARSRRSSGYGRRLPGDASARRSTTRSCTASRAAGCSRDGDLVSIDCGAIVDGWHGDAAITVPVGDGRPRPAPRCSRSTEDALWAGLAAARVGRPAHRHLARGRELGPCAPAAGYGIVEEYVGHGIGTEMHMDPARPNYGRPGRGPAAGRRAWRSRSSR